MPAKDSAWFGALLASGTAIVGVDCDGCTTFWSLGAQALFGWTAEEVLGQVLPIVPMPLLQEWHLQMQRVFASGEPTPAAETQRVTRDGRVIWVLRTSAPVRDEGGQVIGLVDTLTDTTTLKQLDEESRSLSQVRERELIAMDLHDGLIQSLYAAVLNLAAEEQTLGPTQEAARSALKEGRAEVERVIAETREYVANLRGRQFTPRNLETGLRLLVEGLRLNASVEVELEFDPSIEAMLQPEVRGQLLYLAREAISNVVRHAHASRVRIKLGRSATEVVLKIVDNGQGFSTSGRRTTTERQRGLHNMAERARLVGGRLQIQSRPGRGTRLYLELPV
jgi:PAS domain S-box-containing protein